MKFELTMEPGERFCINNEKVFIEINTLGELMGLIKKVGKVIIDEDSIEIYNDYRE